MRLIIRNNNVYGLGCGSEWFADIRTGGGWAYPGETQGRYHMKYVYLKYVDDAFPMALRIRRDCYLLWSRQQDQLGHKRDF